VSVASAPPYDAGMHCTPASRRFLVCPKRLAPTVAKLTTLVWLTVAAHQAHADTATALPSAVLAALSQSGVPAQAVSLLVWPVDATAPRLAYRADEVRQVASVMKLFTTGAALQALGPAYTWKTDVALGGPLRPDGTLEGPLYVRGDGDPSLAIERVQLMLSRWRAAGLRHIQGDIVLDHSAFELPAHDPKAFDGQQLKAYNAGPDALLLNLNAITLRLAPDASQSGAVRVSMEPMLDGVDIDANVRAQASAPCGDWREALSLSLQPLPPSVGEPTPKGHQRWQVRLRGPYPLACGEREWPVLWQGDGPGDHAERLLSAAWQQTGGQLDGRVRSGSWPQAAQPWQSWTSPPLGTVVRDINKFSNNVMARQVFLTLGKGMDATARTPNTLPLARQAVQQQVLTATRDGQGRSPCEGEALVLDNGSGLSRTERSSAQCLGRWLQALWRSPVMPDLVASLPITGQDGTTRRWRSVPGRAHLKTGSLDGVVALAGYVDADSGQRQVVVAVVNHPKADAARPALEALVNWALHDASTP
jgi:D-alanyl-D-alanine carboxypeptidase/D-alanyl-D-alanine-endopeptidase (penicillin-binding protein 4)